MTGFNFCLRHAVLDSPDRREDQDGYSRCVSPIGVRWFLPNWSSVSLACRRASHLSARTETWPKDAPVAGRSCDEAARLRELATGFAECASLRLHRTGRIHSANLRAFLRNLASPERDEGRKRKAAQRSDAVPLTHPPVPVGKSWTDQPLAGRAMDCASSAAAQDVPSAEPGQCLRSRAASPHDRQAIGSHLWPTLLCEEKGGAVGGSPAKRLTSLATANTDRAVTRSTQLSESRFLCGRREKRLTSLATAEKREATEQGERECAQ